MDLDIVWDHQLLFGKDVLHLEQWCGEELVDGGELGFNKCWSSTKVRIGDYRRNAKE